MFARIYVVSLFLLLSFSYRCQDKAPLPAAVKPLIVNKGFDRSVLITFAKQYLGTPYRSAGNDPKKGFDCSGFVYFVFKHFNIEVPRSSREFQFLGKALTPKEFKLGDVVVFYGYMDRNEIGHVGIICEANGTKSKFIHASSGKAYAVTISELDSDEYRHRFYKCINVIK